MHKGTHYDFSVYDNCYIITPQKHPALQTSRPQSGVFILRTSFFVLRFISVAASSGHGYDLLLHLVDNYLYVGGRYLTVAVQVVLEGVVLVQIGSSRRGDITIDAVLCDAIQLEAAPRIIGITV